MELCAQLIKGWIFSPFPLVFVAQQDRAFAS